MVRLIYIFMLLFAQSTLASGVEVVNVVTDDFEGKYLGLKTYWYHGDATINEVTYGAEAAYLLPDQT